MLPDKEVRLGFHLLLLLLLCSHQESDTDPPALWNGSLAPPHTDVLRSPQQHPAVLISAKRQNGHVWPLPSFEHWRNTRVDHRSEPAFSTDTSFRRMRFKVPAKAAGLTWYVAADAGWTGGVGLGLAAGTGEGARALSWIFLCASSCSCFSLACRRCRSSSALFLSSSSFCFAMFSKRALMLPVLLPATNQKYAKFVSC